MKKILFYLCGIYNGGTEIETLNLIKSLDSTKYEILYYYFDKENSDDSVVNMFNSYARYVDIKENQIVDTIIYCTHALDNMEDLKNIKYNNSYFWFHYFWEDQEEFLKICLEKNLINKVITVSQYAKQKLLNFNFMQGKENMVSVIYNILPVEEIKKKSEFNIDFKKAQGLNLVTVARFAPIKGYARIKEMIDILLKESIDFKWYIIGKGSNSKEHNEVLELLKDYDNRVELTGYLENPYPYIKKSDYLVLMSDRETSGLVITEAKILGTPCIVSDFEATFEQIEDGKNGFIIKKENINGFKERLPQIIMLKEELKNNLSEFSYGINEIMNEWEKMLNT